MNKDTLLRWLGRSFIPNIGTLLIVALMLAYQQATAQSGATNSSTPLVTSTFAYQGFLTNTAGQPINGNRALTFRLYGGASGGQPLWVEVRNGQNSVVIENGLFEVSLGEITPIPASVWDTATLYLGVQVEAEAELSPRETIGLVPVAQRAITADQADLALTVPDGSITSEKLDPTIQHVVLDEYIELTNDPQTVLTTTFSVSHPARLLLITHLDMVVSNTYAFGTILVDNAPMTSSIEAGTISGPSNFVMGTSSNTNIIDIQPGTHEIEITVELFDQSPGTGTIRPAGSGITYVILSQ